MQIYFLFYNLLVSFAKRNLEKLLVNKSSKQIVRFEVGGANCPKIKVALICFTQMTF